MTTDEIAAAVQGGEKDILELWAAVEKFVYMKSRRWYMALGGRGGMTTEDFIQEAFPALLDALETWEPEAGSFLTWYGLRLRSAFTQAAGLRTERERRDPLQSCVSLETPLDEDGDLLLGDTIEDKSAVEALDTIAERDYALRLHNALCTALAGLPAAQREAVVSYYVYGEKVSTKDRSDGLRALRKPAVSASLREFS